MVPVNPRSKLSGAYRLFFGTLANEGRLQLINALRKKKLNVTQLCQITGFEQSLVSHNLTTLEYHGMVFRERQGRFRYYSVNEKTIKPLLDLIEVHMNEYCCKILTGER